MLITTNANTISRMIRDFGRRLPKNTARGMDIWARRTAASVKKVAPVGRTRNLRRSIYGRGELRGSKPSAFIVAPLKYAIYLEKGTKSHLVMPRRRMALRWIPRGGRGYRFSRGHRVRGISPRRFFFPTIRAAFDDLADLIWRSCAMALPK